MDKCTEIISKLQDSLKDLDYVHAMWLEGSVAQGFGDEYSDIDVWFEVDPDKIDKTYELIKTSLEQIGPIDLEYEVFKDNDQRHIIYHIEGTTEFLTIDVNVQPFPGKSGFDKGIDIIDVVFNKDAELKFYDSKAADFDEAKSKERILHYYKAMRPLVIKNIRRGKPIEAKIYYDHIIGMAVKFLRRKSGLDAKLEYGNKHIYRDLDEKHIMDIEGFIFVMPEELESKLDEMDDWLKEL